MKMYLSTDLEEVASMSPMPRIIHLILLDFILGCLEEPPLYEKLHLDSSDLFLNKNDDSKSMKIFKEVDGKIIEEPPPPPHLGKYVVQAILNKYFVNPHPGEENAQTIDFDLTDGKTIRLRLIHHPQGKILFEKLAD